MKKMKKEVKKVVPVKAGKKGMSVGKKLAIGAGLAAVGAGAYMLLGPKGKANQKKVKVLINKAKGQAKVGMNKLKLSAGKEMKNANKEIKKEWVKLLAQTKSKAKPIIKDLKKNAKTSAKKVVKVVRKYSK